jgi:hypothetical protein
VWSPPPTTGCVCFSFCGWGCGRVQFIYTQNSIIKINFFCFLWLF